MHTWSQLGGVSSSKPLQPGAISGRWAPNWSCARSAGTVSLQSGVSSPTLSKTNTRLNPAEAQFACARRLAKPARPQLHLPAHVLTTATPCAAAEAVLNSNPNPAAHVIMIMISTAAPCAVAGAKLTTRKTHQTMATAISTQLHATALPQHSHQHMAKQLYAIYLCTHTWSHSLKPASHPLPCTASLKREKAVGVADPCNPICTGQNPGVPSSS